MMIFVFIFFLVIIGGGIAAGTYLFFGGDYDFRYVEAQNLNYHVGICLIEQDVNLDLKEEFYSKCKLNRNVVEKELFILIKANGEKKFDSGRGDEVQCKLNSRNQKYFECFEEQFSKEVNGQTIVFSVLTGSNQRLGRKVT